MSVLEAHPHAAAVLGAALRGHPSHAYLFHGPAGSGKREAAREFAAELLAREAPDPENARARVLAGVHPDLTWVAPSGAHIMLRGDVDQSVVAAAGHTPFEATYRVFVLERADTMDDPAANTLLKTLEEPPAYVVLILLTDRATQVLPTITSRCQGVRFDPPPPARLAERLESRGVAPSSARACARLSLGDGERALALSLGDGPALRARAESFARAPLAGETGRTRPWGEVIASARALAQAAEAELEAALADELSYLPKKEHRRKQTEFSERARRAARRAETGAHRPRAPARRPVVPRPRLPGRRRGGARARLRPPRGAARRRPGARRDRPRGRRRPRRGHARAAAVQRLLRPRPAGARVPARAAARALRRHGMTEVRIRGAYATVKGPGIEDEVAVEEPLEIRVDGEPIAVTMRTPGEDEELALGFLHGEGLIDAPHDAGPPPDLAANAVDVVGPLLREPGSRSFYATSSCGVCGKGALEEVAVHAPPVADGPRIARSLLADAARPPAPADLRAHRRPARHRPVQRRAASR